MGSIRNISAFDLSNNRSFTFTIDCKKTLLGIDTSPLNHMRAKTLSETAYEKYVKEWKSLNYYSSSKI